MKIFVKVCYGVLILSVLLIIVGFLSGATIDSVKSAITSKDNYISYDETIEEAFDTLTIHSDNKNIEIVMTDDLVYPRIKYRLKSDETLKTELINNNLTITISVEFKFLIGFPISFPTIEDQTVYIELPEIYRGSLIVNSKAGNVKLETTLADAKVGSEFGNIIIKGSYHNLNIDSSAGNVEVSQASINSNLIVKSAVGNINIENTSVSGNINASLSTGNIYINNTYSSEYKLFSSVGNITVKLPLIINDYALKLESNIGDVMLNNTLVTKSYQSGNGRLVEVKTSTGNIKVTTN
ncbi:DUF4097 family beta strand repeat-containing protein [Acholeplasma granularum]|uniref:DUF4097 family beta strand repeat-containing protein n=1 Tax=Acholeplasma granularum TaxID=264635 RepID=UPI000470C2FE|nr:DUF4097 family beta strand repeat-containing protein [Acholeplasma granularum]